MPFLFFLVAGLTVLFYAVIRQRHRGLRLPPSPFGLPVLGHFHLLAPLPHQALHRLAERHGPLLYLRLGSVPCIAACSPDAARQVLKVNETVFVDRPQTVAMHRFSYGGQDFIFGSYGPHWSFMKKACVHDLLARRTIDRLRHVRREEVARLVLSLGQSAAVVAPVDMNATFMGLSGDIVSRMVMSRRWTSGDDNDTEEMMSVVAETAEIAGTINLQDYIGLFRYWDVQGLGKRIDAVHRKFDAMLERILMARDIKRRQRREADNLDGDKWDEKDILDILLDMHEDEDAEIRLNRENIKAFMMSIFGAGTDTLAITLEWALSELINNPDVLRRAQEEMDVVVGKDRLVDESDIPSLPYLQAVCKETLRLHPAGPLVVRRSMEQCKVSGYDVPAGASVFVNAWAIGRDPSCWPEPLKFRPERFLEGEKGCNAGTDVRGQHFHLLPFGSGRRMCPGLSLAMLVVQAALAAMVQCFEWRTVGNSVVVDMEEGPGLTLPRKHPLTCFVAPRLQPLPTP